MASSPYGHRSSSLQRWTQLYRLARVLLVATCIYVLLPQSLSAAPGFSCGSITDTTTAECNALMTLYSGTGGANWTNKTGWSESTTICNGGWYGVTCDGAGNVISINLPSNNLTGNFEIAKGNLNSLISLNLNYNKLTIFHDNRMVSLTTYLGLHDNLLLSLISNGTSQLQTLEAQNNQLTTFSGIWTKLTYLDVSSNLLTTFDGAKLNSLESLYISDNTLLPSLTLSNGELSTFVAGGMSSLTQLDLHDNRLTTFSGEGLTQITSLDIQGNLIASLDPSMSQMTLLPTAIASRNAFFADNCLISFELIPSIISWLNGHSKDNWATRNAACPAPPNVMYFCGTYLSSPTDWNQSTNWRSDVLCQNSAPKNRPDGADIAVILTNVSVNSGVPAIVKILEVRNSAIVSVPISNKSGATLTTALAGGNNDITWTATDPAVTITYAEPVEQATTTVDVSGKNITITPGTKARMTLTGTVAPDGSNSVWAQTTLLYDGEINGLSSYGGNALLYYDPYSYRWKVGIQGGTYQSITTGWPDRGSWFGMLPATGAPTVTAAVSSAAQVIAAVANDSSAAALIYGVVAEGDGAGAVIAMPQKTFTLDETYQVPMSFIDTSTNNTSNVLRGDANFGCTTQNLGIVTGATTFTQCSAPGAPTTTSAAIDTTPTFTGLCTPNTLVTLYNEATALLPGVLCSAGGAYTLTRTLAPATYSISVKQSNRKGALFGTSEPSFPVLTHTIGCAAGSLWNGISCASTCTTTEAPSELKANVDKPYISCTNAALGSRFKYRISNTNDATFIPVLSTDNATGARVLHDGVLPVTIPSEAQSGTLDTTFTQTGTGLNGSTTAIILQPNGKTIVGGTFTTYNSLAAPYLIRLNADGTRDSNFNIGRIGLNGYIASMVIQPDDDKIIIAGGFTTYNGIPAPYLIRLNADGTRDSSFNTGGTGTESAVYDIALQPNGKILVGGNFSTYNGSAAKYLIRLNPDGTRDTGFGLTGMGLNGEIYGISLQSNKQIILHGAFTTYNGLDALGIVRLNPDGTRDGEFNLTGTGFNGYISTVVPSDDKIYVGGSFTTYAGIPAFRLIRLNTDGTRDESFNPTGTGLNREVYAIAVQTDGKIFIGGPLTTYNGSVAKYLIRLNKDGTRDNGFSLTGTGFNSYVSSITLSDGKMILGGVFTTYNGSAAKYLIRLNVEGVRDGYKVECLYGDGTIFYPDTCTKTITVHPTTKDHEVQGCASVGNYYENTLNYETWLSPTAFTASVSCKARLPDPEVANPFLLGYNGVFTGLGYLGQLPGPDGRFSSAIDVHTFESGLSTSVTCAVRVGDGYSTNSLCQNIGCGGAGCSAPSAYIIKPHYESLFCTKEEEILYDIGCAGSSPGYMGCIDTTTPGDNHLYDDLTFVRPGVYTKSLHFRIEGVDNESTSIVMTCTSDKPQTKDDTSVEHCTLSLPTDKELALRVGEQDGVRQYQTVYMTVPRDTDAPIATIQAESGSGVSSDGKMLTSQRWLNKPFTATVTCINEAVENNDTCTCALLLKTGTEIQRDSTDWAFTPPLRDIVPYQRIIWNETLNNQTFYVYDNAGNYDTTKSKVTINLGIDAYPPSVTKKSESPPKEDGTIEVILQATDSGSGLWEYPIQAKEIALSETDLGAHYSDTGNCGVVTAPNTPNYISFPKTGLKSKDSGPFSYNPVNEKIVYCIQDNAGNQLVGTYPFEPDNLIGCFSDGSQQIVPNLDITDITHYYKYDLIKRIGGQSPYENPTYGYEFTDSARSIPMTDFRTKLAQNIQIYIRQSYCPTKSNFSVLSIDIEEQGTEEDPLRYAAQIKKSGVCLDPDGEEIITRNNNGYYYFQGDASNRIVELSGEKFLKGNKVVLAEGADIYFRGDISYFSRDAGLVIIALKDSAGVGGNIYVHPDVTHLDATLIADGALMNGELDQGTMVPKVWFEDFAGVLKNPLTINGRLLTHNTRGGSLRVTSEGGNDILKKANDGICATSNGTSDVCALLGEIPSPEPSALKIAGLQDLERFRVVTRVSDESNHRCTLHVTGVMSQSRPDILTSIDFEKNV